MGNGHLVRHSVGFGSVEKVGPGTRHPRWRTTVCQGSGKLVEGVKMTDREMGALLKVERLRERAKNGPGQLTAVDELADLARRLVLERRRLVLEARRAARTRRRPHQGA